MGQVSIKDVARIAGVSIATVSRCINEPGRVKSGTRDRVQQAIKATGYAPNALAQNFRRGKTQVIMVVLPSVGDPFFTDVMKGIRNVAGTAGYSLLINETRFNTLSADQVGAMVVSRQADGIVLLASLSPFGTQVFSEGHENALPVVVACETVSDDLSGFPGVHIDNVAAAQEATHYLLRLGHRKIAFIHGQQGSMLTRDREGGFLAAMKQAGVEVEPGWLLEGGLSIEGASRATARLLEHRHRPTAIFCANDEMALGCMHTLKSAGLRIPGDISVVGFDDIRYAAVADPPLTTVAQPAEEIGKRVMHRLLREIDGDHSAEPAVEIAPHRLVIRASAGPPPELQTYRDCR